MQLPKGPFPQPVWINLKEDWGEDATKLEILPPAHLYIWNDKVISIEKYEGDKFWYQEAEAEDVDCLGEILSRVKRSALIKELYDSDGHLKVQFKFPQGC